MSKRPAINLGDITADVAMPMVEGVQRAPQVARQDNIASEPAGRRPSADKEARTENLKALSFKVPANFRHRFRKAAADADMKLNEVLFEALALWEEKRKGGKG